VNTITHNSSTPIIESTPVTTSVKLAQIDTPLVSVIIPVYNSAKYIHKAIDSVLEQTYSNYEIIVVDDGSTDETRQKLQPYRDKIRYVFQENQGSAVARNLGINLAKGDLVAFLDSDDLWSMPEKLEKQVACFQENPDLGGINTGWRIIDGAGKHIKTVQPWHKAPQLDLETWLKKKCVRTSAMMFRHSWLEKVGGFDPELRQSHDVDLILRLSLAGCKTEWLKEETVCYRQHDLNTTKDSLKQAKYIQAVLDKFFARNDLPESINQQERQIRYHTLVWIAWYQYNADNLDEMANFLQKSLDFSPYLRVENISHWLSSFKRFSQERGQQLDVDFITDSLQWQKLTISTVNLIAYTSKNIIEKFQDNKYEKNQYHGVDEFSVLETKLNSKLTKSLEGKKIFEKEYLSNIPNFEDKAIESQAYLIDFYAGHHKHRKITSYKVDIIVCVHNALEDVRNCLNAILCHTTVDYRLIVVDDGSQIETQEFVQRWVDQVKTSFLIRNSIARGYTKAANQGLKASKNEYIVLLNSDTIVTPQWLEKMVECAKSDLNIGVIGPLSNCASWQSIPEVFNEKGDWMINKIPQSYSLERYSKLIENLSDKSFPKVRFVNGFCYMITRKTLDTIGFLDEESFPHGYGEENDFSLRVAQAGFKLAIADHTYVYHAKSKSFGHQRRKELSKQGSKALREKHPDINFKVLSSAIKNCESLENLRLKILENINLNNT
jgi:GT2 family glycosyltransferase